MPVSSVGAGDSAVAFGVAVGSPVPVDDEVAGREVFAGAEVAGSAVDDPEVGPAGADVAAVAWPAESRVGANVGVSVATSAGKGRNGNNGQKRNRQEQRPAVPAKEGYRVQRSTSKRLCRLLR